MNLAETKHILERFSILPRHSLGQNFLVSDEISRQIVNLSAIEPQDTVIEIGPGIGALTEKIVASSKQAIVYEIDHRMVEVLESRFSNEKLVIVENDILKEDLSEQFKARESVKVIANLPYYITSEIIEKLICEVPHSQSMCLMMQKEAAERLLIKENDSRFGVTAILISLYGGVKQKVKVTADKFYPRPKVHSVVLYIENDSDNCFMEYQKQNPDFQISHFKDFLQNAFSMRRKTLFNNLRKNYPEWSVQEIELILQKHEISLKSRPEQIPAKAFWKLYLSMAK